MKKITTIKEYLKNTLNPEELLLLNRSFEIVGDIAICEIPVELSKFDEEIGNAILNVNRAIKVVLKKSGIHKGEFRTQDLIHIAGENRKETIHRENNIQLLINPQTVYFSSKLSTEREKLMENLEENKRILVMFSGGGPYSFVAFRKQPNLARITSIEINPTGNKYAIKSLELNKNIIKKSKLYKDLILFLRENKLEIKEKELVLKLNNLKLNFINGDVRKEIKKLKLESYNEEINKYHNILFEQNPKDLFNFLKSIKDKKIYLDFDSKILNFNKILNFLILFSYEFEFICKINNKKYIFSNYLTKGYLLNYLECIIKNNNSIFDIKNINLYDEIYMPLPKTAEEFLYSAFEIADKNCIIHMYDFMKIEEFPKKTENKIKEISKQFGKKIEILNTRKVGQSSPGKYRTCCDFKILN